MKTVDYHLYWLTKNLAVGRAPMSYADLDHLKKQDINVIINLCGEYSDLHQLEEDAGFEVVWIPIADETAPTMEQMEKGLELLDEAVYLGKKVLVHCRHGIGRTGTFVTAYLLRRGFNLKQAAKILKPARANPSNFSQWWLLRKFGKKQSRLTVENPTTHNREHHDLEPFFQQYELLLETIDRAFPESAQSNSPAHCYSCDPETSLQFIEALYLHTKANVHLTSDGRNEMIQRVREFQRSGHTDSKGINIHDEDTSQIPLPIINGCALFQEKTCKLYNYRPVGCRLQNKQLSVQDKAMIYNELNKLSRDLFTAVFGGETDSAPPAVKLVDVISGRFIQNYFQHIKIRSKNNSHQ